MKNHKFIFIVFVSIIFSATNSYSNENIISLIENEWNNTQTLSGNFIQTDQNNKIEEGKFYIQKPYKSFFKYNKKNEHFITGRFLLHIVDDARFEIESYPLQGHLLKKILNNNLNINENANIISFKEINDQYIITTQSEPNEQIVMLFFDTENFTLNKWEILDEFNQKTSLEFTNIIKNISIDLNKFSVRYNN